MAVNRKNISFDDEILNEFHVFMKYERCGYAEAVRRFCLTVMPLWRQSKEQQGVVFSDDEKGPFYMSLKNQKSNPSS